MKTFLVVCAALAASLAGLAACGGKSGGSGGSSVVGTWVLDAAEMKVVMTDRLKKAPPEGVKPEDIRAIVDEQMDDLIGVSVELEMKADHTFAFRIELPGPDGAPMKRSGCGCAIVGPRMRPATSA